MPQNIGGFKNGNLFMKKTPQNFDLVKEENIEVTSIKSQRKRKLNFFNNVWNQSCIIHRPAEKLSLQIEFLLP